VNDPASGVGVEKLEGVGGGVQWKNYIFATGGMVAAVYENSAGPSQTRYFHKDHLGSIVAITDETGVVLERLSYDPWGKRRHPDGSDDPTGSIVSLTDRGFTGHEHLEEVGIVHMNGRVYDPLVARVASVDPIVSDPDDSQSFNRYSYVRNSPLSLVDPSGYQPTNDSGPDYLPDYRPGTYNPDGSFNLRPVTVYASGRSEEPSGQLPAGTYFVGSPIAAGGPTVPTVLGTAAATSGTGIAPSAGGFLSTIGSAANATGRYLSWCAEECLVINYFTSSRWGMRVGLGAAFDLCGAFCDPGAYASIHPIVGVFGMGGLGPLRWVATNPRSVTIASNGATGNPAAIARGLGTLNTRQATVLDQLPGSGYSTIVSKAFGQRDLAALTAYTGDEFAMFSTGGRRLVFRGNVDSVPITPEAAVSLSEQGWRWSTHVHPGFDTRVLRSSEGDRAILGAMGGRQSTVLNSLGQRRLFTPEGDSLNGWTP
jgi:RHS repeat-associated protein